jgi:hypothetical protein
MALVIGGGISVGGSITVGPVPLPTPAANYISTETPDPLLTESGDNLITES